MYGLVYERIKYLTENNKETDSVVDDINDKGSIIKVQGSFLSF